MKRLGCSAGRISSRRQARGVHQTSQNNIGIKKNQAEAGELPVGYSSLTLWMIDRVQPTLDLNASANVPFAASWPGSSLVRDSIGLEYCQDIDKLTSIVKSYGAATFIVVAYAYCQKQSRLS
ncbi:hypothetical protein FPSE_07184 [Fusarium pseudograminearum CS3096]|uniref:Uncharacterized protein n=1 Tax=Fusarium pseudograminearum (strain CS3096) TaxID=1028729 RepID=K3VEG6_FUSPC|nr:hypothetical protein FPSE_07184 [Fusarium pseudograminearum CS3096]EKJ72547.1 hypothetical protein FPSE_07184 [Fusarium pseudograminearum CS3096]